MFQPFWSPKTHPFLWGQKDGLTLGSAFEEVCFTSYLFSWFVVLPLWLDEGSKEGWSKLGPVYLFPQIMEKCGCILLHVGCSSLHTHTIMEWGWLVTFFFFRLI